MTAIGKNAFQNCTSLTNITIPDSVISIGIGAFNNCSGLASITIPSSVKCIERFAFDGCIGLTDIYVNQPESTLLDYADVPSGCRIHWNSMGPEESV